MRKELPGVDEKSRDFIEILKSKLREITFPDGPERENARRGAVVETKKELLRRRIAVDMYFLAEQILGVGEWYLKPPKHIFNKKFWRKRLDPVLHRKMCRELMRDEDTLQLYPRNHMKSTMVKVWIVWKLVQNPLFCIGLFSKTTGLSKKQLSSIKGMLTTPLLRELYPDIIPERKLWQVDNKTQLIMKRPEEFTKQESQVDVFGIDNTVAGGHYDAHVYDDIIDDKTVRSAAQIEKVQSAWEFLQVVKDTGAMEKMVGTRYHLHDIYGHIIRQKLFKEENTIIVKCRKADGQPIYSLYKNKDLIILKKKMGDANFSTQMDNDPVSATDKIFTGPYPMYDVEIVKKHVPPQFREYFAALDPAATATKTSDQSGISIGFIDVRDPRCLFLERSYGVKLKSEKLAEEVIRIQLQYDPKIFGIETGLQEHLKTVIRLKVVEWETVNKRNLKYKILPISTGHMNKAVKFSRVLAPFLNDRRILYPASRLGDELTLLPEFKSVIYQLDFYNPFSDKNDDDIIDSQNMIIQCVPNFSQAHWSNVKHEDTDEGFTYESIYKNYLQPKVSGWGSNMKV